MVALRCTVVDNVLSRADPTPSARTHTHSLTHSHTHSHSHTHTHTHARTHTHTHTHINTHTHTHTHRSNYRNSFIGADPVWNVTGSGGTNLKCLAAHTTEPWKCLMAPYIAQFIETPLYVMNSAFDAWQMGNILMAPCIPTPTRPCTAQQNVSLQAYHDQFISNISVVTAGKPKNGVFIDGCYVHEQNVNYCR
jgi:hypothetical protein